MKKKKAQISRKIWAVLPAAGSGRRFSPTALKQYQVIQNKTVLEHSVNAVFQLPLAGCVLAIHANDHTIHQIKFSQQKKLFFCEGGQERVHSVLNALYLLKGIAEDDDWVLVHDAARPCVSKECLIKLVEQAVESESATILAVPVRDTLKRVSDHVIKETVDRDQLWQAQTPQIAQIGQLVAALEHGLSLGYEITDEASALELAGHTVNVVIGRSDNIKITYPEDLNFADLVLTSR